MAANDYSYVELQNHGKLGQVPSDLVPTGEHSHLPEAVHDGSNLPEVAYDRDTLPEATPDKFDGAVFPAPSRGYGTQRTRFLGMTRRTLLISGIIVALVIAAAIAGGVAGGLKNAHHSSSSTGAGTPPNNTIPPAVVTNLTAGPLSGSKLAAVNWTDEEGIERRAVFYQMNNNLFLSQVQTSSNSSSNQTWIHVNISAQIALDSQALPLNPRNGTPLAAAATPWQAGKNAPWDPKGTNGEASTFAVSLYYFNADYQIRQLWSDVGNLSTWQEGGRFPEVAISSPSHNSQLGATGYYCASGCLNEMCIVFQGDDNTVRCSCNQDGYATVSEGYPNSPLAFLPLAANEGRNITYDSELVLFYLDNLNIDVAVFNSDDDGIWGAGAATSMTIQAPPANGALPQLAASVSDAVANISLVSLATDGSLTSSFYGGGYTWTGNKVPSFTNEGGSSTSSRPGVNISAVAMDNDHRFYGLSADGSAILEYEWSSQNPFLFTWVGNVTIP